MCVSATVSFGLSGLLVAGGGLCLYKAQSTDNRYRPMAFFPIIVGIQQAAEGSVWNGFSAGDEASVTFWAMVYLFFTWMVWPVWAPYMTAVLEPDPQRKKLFGRLAATGMVLGIILYAPYFWNPGWLEVKTVSNAISYNCSFVTESFFPRWVTYLLYLSLIGLPPLISSHLFLRIFGAALVAAVPLTYFLFSYAHVSVLCFFAALITLYIVYIIIADKCHVAPSHLQQQQRI